MIQVRCSGCSKLYAVPDEYGGKKTRCKQCAAIISIPAPGAAAAPPPPEPEAAPPEPVASSAEADSGNVAPGAADSGTGAATAASGAGARKPFGKPKFPSGKLSKGGAPGKAGTGIPKKGFAAGKKIGASKLGKKAAPGGLKSRPAKAVAAEGEEPAEGAEGPVDSRKRLILIGGGAVGVIAVAAVVYFAFFAGGDPGGTGPAKKGPVATVPKDASKPGPSAASPSGAPGKGAPDASSATSPSEAGGAATPVAGAADLSDSLSFIPGDANLIAQVAFGRLRNLPGFDAWIDDSLQSGEVAAILEESGLDAGSIATVWLAAKVTGTETEEDPPQPLAIVEGTFDREKFIEGLKGASRIASKPRSVEGHDVYPVTLETESPVEVYLTFLSDTKLLIGESKMINASLGLLSGGESVRSNKVLASLSQNFSADKVVWAAFDLPQALKDQIQAMAKGGGPMGAGKPPAMEDFSSSDEATEGAADADADADADVDAGVDETVGDEPVGDEDEATEDAAAENAPSETPSETPSEEDDGTLEPDPDAVSEDAAAEDDSAEGAADADTEVDAEASDAEEPEGGPSGAEAPQIPSVDGVFFALDPTPDGESVGVEVGVQCPTEEDAKSLQKLAAGYILMARMGAPKELKPLLETLKLVPEGQVLRAKVMIPAEILEQLKTLLPVPGAAAGAEGEAEEAEDGVEPEDAPTAPDAEMAPDDAGAPEEETTPDDAEPDTSEESADDSTDEIEADLDKVLEGTE